MAPSPETLDPVPPQLLPHSNDSEDLAGFQDENGWHPFEAN